MYATGSAVREIDRKRLRTSVVVSLILWTVFLPILSLLRYDGPIVEPSMNPIYIELEPPAPSEQVEVAEEAPPAETSRPARTPLEPEMVEIAEETSHAAAPAPAPAPETAAVTPSLRPDPSAAPVASRRTTPSSARGGADPFAPLSEDALKAAAPPAPEPGTPPPQTGKPTDRTSSKTASSGTARSDAFDRTLRTASERLASVPATSAGSASSGTAAAAPRADMDGGFDFGEGAKRELLSPRRIRVPDKLLAGLPEIVSTMVSFKIEAGGTVYKSSIRFDPPLPEELTAYLRTAFAAWQFSFSDSDGQVVFRYSIKVR